ncbi:RAB6-interacting golgin-like [Clytia hemisphaerica]|uniref:RAB6-interacting golgin-like n=1 Tax=Clytia hemisphaerica TaxID=252671 RepID=UPI0034D4C5EA
MAGWNGFTEQELLNLQDSDVPKRRNKATKPKPSKIDGTQRKVEKKRPKPIPHPQVDNTQVEKMEKDVSNTSVPGDSTKDDSDCQNNSGKDTTSTGSISDTAIKDVPPKQQPVCTNIEEKKEVDIRVLTDTEAAEKQMSSLAKLQIQQKVIEEQNKKKQSMIKEALAERMRQTQHESKKLMQINKELSKLDQLLQVDVKILRDKIDDACVEFSQAQKRFQDAEKEYVNAKLDYYKKKEHKDELQEHLYTIIQENEIRKAKKLEELMAKLNANVESPVHSPIEAKQTPELGEQKSTAVENSN